MTPWFLSQNLKKKKNKNIGQKRKFATQNIHKADSIWLHAFKYYAEKSPGLFEFRSKTALPNKITQVDVLFIRAEAISLRVRLRDFYPAYMKKFTITREKVTENAFVILEDYYIFPPILKTFVILIN